MADAVRRMVDKATAFLRGESQLLEREEKALESAKEMVKHAYAAVHIIDTIADDLQKETHAVVENIVNQCLEAVFNDTYEFKIIIEEKRDKRQATFVFMRGENEINPLTAAGGGVVDVTSFALRMACLVLSRPQSPKILVLDEPFKFVSADKRGKVASLLEELANEIGVQLIMVTHLPELEIGTVHKVM